ncbi:TonB family protein [Paracidovorax wautersii]|uniref:TonB family protein n=1 Tax=Paracidovorax wautersii TaxID=1177982 RepID=A0ABU1IEZ7_9BURK|nr:TonB family protein [Paracidovorax wautersii]MDR6215785.1 TonB family protein [Paracidovorax wautersii]
MNRTHALLSCLLAGLVLAGCSTSSVNLPPRGAEATEVDATNFRQGEAERMLRQQISPPLDAPLRIVEFAEPRYPSFLLADSARSPRGDVVVSFELLPSGAVGATKVLSKTDETLNKAAVAAIRSWRFSPPLRDGKPARLFLQHTFRIEP